MQTGISSRSPEQTTELAQNSLAADFYSCLINNKFSDVTFIVQKQVYHAHKLVLAARSKYFEQLLSSKQGPVEVEIQNASPDIFRVILEYIYTDLAFLDLSNVWGVHTAGKYYNLDGLTTKCVAFIISAVESQNVFEIWKCAQGAGISQVVDYCVHFISKTFHTLLHNNNNLQEQAPEQIQQQVSQHLQQQQQKTDTDDELDVMKAVSNYKFPYTNTSPNNNNDSTLSFNDVSNNQQQQQQQQQKSQNQQQQQQQHEALDLQLEDFPSWTQTFELEDANTPPAAFPTAEALSAFPSFFFNTESNKSNADQPQGQPKQHTANTDISKKDEADKNIDHSDESKSNESQGSFDPSRRRNSKVTRRLSVISDPNNLGVVFQYLISCVTRLMDADRTTLFLYDRNTDELCSQVSIGEHEIRIPSDKGIAGSVFRSGKSVNVKDAYSDAKFNSNVDKSTGYNTRFVICSPIISHKTSDIVGVIEVLNKRGGPFNEVDEGHMNTVAELFAILVDDPNITKMSQVLVPPANTESSDLPPLDMDLSPLFNNQDTSDINDWQSLFNGIFDSNDNITLNTNNNFTTPNATTPNFDESSSTTTAMKQEPSIQPTQSPASFLLADPSSNSSASIDQKQQQSQLQSQSQSQQDSSYSPSSSNQSGFTQFAKPPPEQKPVQKTRSNSQRPRKRKRESVPFMHFRIPRYELQFIPYNGQQQNRTTRPPNKSTKLGSNSGQ